MIGSKFDQRTTLTDTEIIRLALETARLNIAAGHPVAVKMGEVEYTDLLLHALAAGRMIVHHDGDRVALVMNKPGGMVQ